MSEYYFDGVPETQLQKDTSARIAELEAENMMLRKGLSEAVYLLGLSGFDYDDEDLPPGARRVLAALAGKEGE